MNATATRKARPTSTTEDLVAIYFPYLYISDSRIACVGTLPDGTEWNARMPLEAAVEIELAGYDIRVVGNLDD